MLKSQLIEVLKLDAKQLTQPVICVPHPQHPEIYVMILNQKANTYTFDFVRQIHQALDIVEEHEGQTCLITTSFHASIFSAGLDLNFLAPLNNFDKTNFILEFIRLLGRFLSLSVPSIALVNGHAVAGGCMLMFAHDWRFGRAEAGKALISMPEIEIAMYLPPGMNAVCQCKLTPNVHRDLCLIARRFDLATEGISNSIVDGIETEGKLFELALGKALKVAKYGQDKVNYKKIKCEMYKEAIDSCCNKQMAAGVMFEIGAAKL